MSDKEDSEQSEEKPFYVEIAKTGRAGCKKCKQKIAKGELRFGKLGFSPFGSGKMKLWHHIPCMFDVFKNQRATTKKIENPDEIGGWEELSEDDKQEIMNYFSPELKNVFKTYSNSVRKDVHSPTKKSKVDGKDSEKNFQYHKDNSFKAFRKLCVDLTNNSSYLKKTKIIADFFEKGSDGDSFKGDIELWCKLLLPGAIVRVYNLQNKQLIKLFSKILNTSQEEMLEDLEKGDVAETIATFFEKSTVITPSKKATLTLQEVDEFLKKLSEMTREDEQTHHFTKIVKKCTANDVKMILRLIKHDLRINAGPKHILEAVHEDAYKAFQTSRDLKTVVADALKARDKTKEVKTNKGMDVSIKMMTPVLPMLAEPCKSVEMALKKCPNGMFSEIKYDGERIQLHKEGDTFKYFSRSLKPVMPYKVKHFKDYIPQAFPYGKDLILDAEILLIDHKTGKPLPFGTLGIHKKNEYQDANVCLFVFDCLYYNGKSLLNATLKERRDILKKNMVEIKNHVMLSEMEEIHKAENLERMIEKVFKLGLEGLVLKDTKSIYEPGKRHWLKVKKDYLFDGVMADSADLVVLGAWFGNGSKGGIMSSFLMGCYDPRTKKYLTVTKVSGGHDDNTLQKIQRELDVVKISKSSSKVPNWLNCNKTMIPDFVAADPKKMPVWEITGAEFTCNQVHTADGISIRFPRVTKIRNDKDWSTATNLCELKDLYSKSKDTSDFSLVKGKSVSTEDDTSEDEAKCDKTAKRKKEDSEGKQEKYSKKARLEEEDHSIYDEDTETEEDEPGNSQTYREAKSPDLANPLPDIFSHCVIQIPRDYKHYEFLRRYLIAYGGVLHDTRATTSVENSRDKVTHVVHLTQQGDLKNEKFWSKNVKHVHVDWLWDSIKLLEQQPESMYIVTARDGN